MAGPTPTDPDAPASGAADLRPPQGIADAPTELRAREVLSEVPQRRVVGQGLAERVGARRWERAPVVCCSARIFKRCEVADPWQPDATDRPIAVGPVGMRFEERRQPAPHARVKEAKKPASPKQAWVPPTGIPQAAAKPAAPKAAAPKPAARKPATTSTAEPAQPSVGRPLAPAKPSPATAKSKMGRFRMRSTSATGPRMHPVPATASPPPAESEEPAPTPEPEAPRPTAQPPPQSLDDLFGSLGQGGRDKRMGRRKP